MIRRMHVQMKRKKSRCMCPFIQRENQFGNFKIQGNINGGTMITCDYSAVSSTASAVSTAVSSASGFGGS